MSKYIVIRNNFLDRHYMKILGNLKKAHFLDYQFKI